MKKRFLNVFVVALMAVTALVGTSCNHDTNIATDDSESKTNGKGAQITFNLTREDFAPETEVNTRGVVQESGRVVASTVSELGNELDVLTEVVENAPAKTRTGEPEYKNLPSGNYTIVAFKDGEQKAKWTFSLNGSTQTVSGEEVRLPAGRYKFYAFSDAGFDTVSDSQGKITSLTSSLNKGTVNAYYYAEEKDIPASGKVALNLVLKSPFARVEVKLKGFSPLAFDGSFNGRILHKKWNSDNVQKDASGQPILDKESKKIPTHVVYSKREINLGNGKETYTPATEDGLLELRGYSDNKVSGEINSYIVSNPCYHLAGTWLSELSYQFTSDSNGSVYAHPVRNRILTFAGLPDKQLEAGKSYTIVQTMYAKAMYYHATNNYGGYELLNAIQCKQRNIIPEGLVVRPRATGMEGIIVATKDAPNNFALYLNNAPFKSNYNQDQNGLNEISKVIEASKVAENRIDHSYWAANYYLGQEYLIKRGFWAFLPGVYECNEAFKIFGALNPIGNFNAENPAYNRWNTTNGNLQKVLFYQVGGEPMSGIYWCCQAWNNGKGITFEIHNEGVRFGADNQKTQHKVRAFMSYK